jgi:hypothetical protein
MPLFAPPVRRGPSALHIFVDHIMNWIYECISYPFRNTRFEYWLLVPVGQVGTIYMTAILVGFIWLIFVHYSVESLKPIAAAEKARARAQAEAEANHTTYDQVVDSPPQSSSPSPIRMFSDDSPHPPSSATEGSPEEETPIMRRLAPESHRPMNAQLEGSPFRVAQPFGSRANRPGTLGFTPLSQRVPVQSHALSKLSRTGHPAEAGYQTPFAAKPTVTGPKAFSTRPLQPSNFSGLAVDAPVAYQTLQGNGMLNADGTPNKWSNPTGDFAKLAREAPASYATLQMNGMLGADGTPTRKWEAEKRMPGHQSFGGKGKENVKNVVAHWANEEGRKDGRAMLRRELDDEDFA